jgi:hypothetical protein
VAGAKAGFAIKPLISMAGWVAGVNSNREQGMSTYRFALDFRRGDIDSMARIYRECAYLSVVW